MIFGPTHYKNCFKRFDAMFEVMLESMLDSVWPPYNLLICAVYGCTTVSRVPLGLPSKGDTKRAEQTQIFFGPMGHTNISYTTEPL